MWRCQVVDAVETVGSQSGTTSAEVKIAKSGQVSWNGEDMP